MTNSTDIELMTALLQAPLCERHGCHKVRINDKRRKEGWFWRCRQCNNESRQRYYAARIKGNNERMDAENARNRERYAANEDVRRQVIERTTQYRENNRDHLNAARRSLNEQRREYDKERWAKLKVEQTWDRVKRVYGMTKEQYDAMLESQNHACAICGSTDPGSTRHKHLTFSIDHCHETGAVRGLLCTLCNTGIGMFRDSPDTLRRAIEYLRARNLSAAVYDCSDASNKDGAG